MGTVKARSTWWLLRRSLSPSATSVAGCIVISILLVTIGVLLSTVSYGTSLPGILNGYWSAQYTDNVVQPILAAVNSSTLSNFAVVIIWSIFGLVVYTLVETAVRAIQGWRDVKRNVQFISDQTALRHPLGEKHFILVMLWRLLIGILMAVLFVAALTFARRSLDIIHSLVINTTLISACKDLGAIVIVWALIGHAGVILLRLYTLRTRLFGDLIY